MKQVMKHGMSRQSQRPQHGEDGPRAQRRRGHRWCARCVLETMESRTLLSANTFYVVTSLTDSVGTVTTAGHAGTQADPYPASSLRAALAVAGSDNITNYDTISFDPTLTSSGPATLNISHSLGQFPTIGGNLTIQGPGPDKLTIEPQVAHDFQIFHIQHDGVFFISNFISGLTLTNGGGMADSRANNAVIGGAIGLDAGLLGLDHCVITNCTAAYGGAIYAGGESLSVDNSLIANNTATTGDGGAIYSTYDSSYSNVTLFGNSAPGKGGAIYSDFGTAILDFTTITNNQANKGGGIYFNSPNGATAHFFGSIIAGNIVTWNGTDPDEWGAGFFSVGDNVIGNVGSGSGWATGDKTGTNAAPLDPKLGPLQDNGGPTETMALLAGSPALGLVPLLAGGPTIDQRGITRTVPADAGAFESVKADLSVTITDDQIAGKALPGTAVSYTITATNAGPAAVTGATLATTLPPAALTNVTFTATGAGGASGFTASGTGGISDTVNLPKNASITYTLSGTIAASATGTLVQGVTITGIPSINEINALNNTATDTLSLTPKADLAIALLDDQHPNATSGHAINYTVTVSNSGPSDAVGTTVADTFPATLTGVTYSATATGGATGFTASGSGNLSDTVTLPSGATIVYHVQGLIPSAANGQFTNTATVTAGGATTDPNTANNSATSTDVINPADLSVTNTPGQTSAVPGTAVSYTIVVANSGPTTAAGVTVSDPFSGAYQVVTHSATATGGATGFAVNGTSAINDTVTLPAGSTITYSVQATVASGATGSSIANTATVTGAANITDLNTANNSTTATDTLTPQVDLAVTLTDSQHPNATRGGRLTYTITVTNAGPSDAVGAALTDTFPATLTNVSFIGRSATGATNFSTGGTGNINDTATIPAGAKITYTVTGTISPTASGQFTNTATAAAATGTTDTNTANNSVNSTDILPAADLSITTTDGQSSVSVGGTTTYTIVVSNAGPNTAANTAILDLFAAPYQNVTYTATQTGGAYGFAPSGNNAIFDLATLPAGSSITYTVTAGIQSNATGETISDTATLTPAANIIDPNLANNSATDTDILTARADLAVTLLDSQHPGARAGDPIHYTITVNNNGPSAAGGATVVDTFPAILTGVSYTASATGGATGFTASGSGNLSDTVSMPSGASIVYHVRGTIPAAATGQFTNTATVATTGNTNDPNTGNNTVTSTDLISRADLSITNTDGQTSAVPGTGVSYTIVVANNGPTDVTGATVTDPFSGAYQGVTYTATATGGATGFTASGVNAINDTVTLPVGSTITYTVNATIASAATGSIANTAAVTAPISITDPNLANNTTADSDTLSPQADVVVTLTDDQSAMSHPGATVTYTLTVNNAGPSDATGVVLTNGLPAMLGGVSFTARAAGGATGFTTAGSGTLHDTLALPSGAQVTYTIRGTVGTSATGTVTDTATATVPAGSTDPNLTNNTASLSDALILQGDVAVSISDNQPPRATPGTGITYTIQVSNSGPNDLTGITLADGFPATLSGITYTATATGGATGFTTTGTGNLSDTLALPVGSTVIYNVSGTIASNASGSFANTATATVPANEMDVAPANNTATDTTLFQIPPAIPVVTSADPAVFQSAVTFTAVISGDGPAATGTVTFSEGSTVLGTGTLDAQGHATFTTSSLFIGSHWITATYNGDTNWLGGTSTPINQLIGTPSQRYVELLYENLLHRPADMYGMSIWAGMLDNGQSYKSVATQFANTPEYDTSVITNLYVTCLGRQPDAPGLALRIGQMQAGMNALDIQAILLGSPEFFARSGGNNSAFVTALYQNILQRTPDPLGLEAWTAVLTTGQDTIAGVARRIAYSDENRAAIVTNLYTTDLERQPDATGLAGYKALLANDITQADLIADFVAAPEFLQINNIV